MNDGTLTSWKITVYGHGYTPGYPQVTSASPGPQQLTIDWDAPSDTGGSDITSYDLRYISSDAADKADSRWTVRTGIGTDDTGTYDLTGLGAGVRYDVEVRAVNDAGTGPWSETFAGATGPVAPGAPSITSTAPRDRALRVSWDKPASDGGAEITSYDLHYIRTDAPDKTDDNNWTVQTGVWRTGGGDLRYDQGNLDNDVSYDVEVRAVNPVGPGEWSATAIGTPTANDPPAFPTTETGMREVDENVGVGSKIGAPVAATDPESDQLTYTLATTSDVFEVVAGTGQLWTKARLDHESAPTHTLTVNVSDGKDSNGDTHPTIDDTVQVTVTVNDVDEPPEIPGRDTITEEETVTGTFATYSATDPEEFFPTFTWSLAGVDAGDFGMSDSGGLRFLTPPNFDAPPGQHRRNTYFVKVRADDGEQTGELDVTVTITAAASRSARAASSASGCCPTTKAPTSAPTRPITSPSRPPRWTTGTR